MNSAVQPSVTCRHRSTTYNNARNWSEIWVAYSQFANCAGCVGIVMELLTGGEVFSRIRTGHYSEKGASLTCARFVRPCIKIYVRGQPRYLAPCLLAT